MRESRCLASWLQVAVATLLLCFATNGPQAAGQAAIVLAAKTQDWDQVETLLKTRDADVNATSADGATALAWAAHWDQVPTAKQLLRAKADPNIANDYGVTPLQLAVKNRGLEMVKLLLDRGADPDAGTWSGVTPIMTAAKTGDADVIKALIKADANVNASEPRRGQTGLMWAIAFGYPEAARVLVESGADVDASTVSLQRDFSPMELEAYTANVSGTEQGGYTPLMFAARNGDIATAKLLLERGADVNADSQSDGPALVLAVAAGHEELAMFLLEAGADPNLGDSGEVTPLHYALRDGMKILHGYNVSAGPQVCNFGGDPTRCKPLGGLSAQERELLADPTSDLYVEDEEVDPREPLPGRTMHRLVEALLDAGADPNARMKFPPAHLRLARLSMLNLTGATPFFLAAAAQDVEAMDVMLAREDVNPLITTSINENIFFDQMEVYADDNQILGNASSLMVAVGMGRKSDFSADEEQRAIEAAEELIHLGADVNEATASGWTPLHAAAYIGANKMIEFLVANGAEINVMNACGQTPISLALGTSVAGLLDRTVPQVDTAELILELGAANVSSDKSIGRCVLGRGGLEADVAQNELVQSRVESIIRRLDAR
jgi:ankyrin repeat protein